MSYLQLKQYANKVWNQYISIRNLLNKKPTSGLTKCQSYKNNHNKINAQNNR